MKLLFGWHIAFEHRYFKSKRNEFILRLWRKVKYHPPKRAKTISIPDSEVKVTVEPLPIKEVE